MLKFFMKIQNGTNEEGTSKVSGGGEHIMDGGSGLRLWRLGKVGGVRGIADR